MPACSACNDLGWVHHDVPLDHPLFGQAVRCACALPGFHQRQQEKARAASNLTDFLRTRHFGNLPQTPANEEAFDHMSTFAVKPSGWIVLRGKTGTGKTHLLAAVANYLLDHPATGEADATAARRGRAWPLYVVVPDFLAYVKAGYDHDRDKFSDSAEERIQQALTADVLLLDDMGAESRTAWVDETLYRIINGRYNEARPTVVATNCALGQLEPRIASRLQDWRISVVVDMVGPDERLRRPAVVKSGVAS